MLRGCQRLAENHHPGGTGPPQPCKSPCCRGVIPLL